jgi:hypothetical protein
MAVRLHTAKWVLATLFLCAIFLTLSSSQIVSSLSTHDHAAKHAWSDLFSRRRISSPGRFYNGMIKSPSGVVSRVFPLPTAIDHNLLSSPILGRLHLVHDASEQTTFSIPEIKKLYDNIAKAYERSLPKKSNQEQKTGSKRDAPLRRSPVISISTTATCPRDGKST